MIHRLLNSLILLPDAYHYQAPADLGLGAEAVTFPNAQGLPLRGVFCWQASQGPVSNVRPEEMPVVLFCPGTSGNLSSHLHYVELLCRAGFAVLGFDYTGFGRSAGKAWLKTLVTDVFCAGDFLRQQKQVKRFGLFGLSIGANVALLAAALRPESVGGVAVEGMALQTEIVRGILTEGVMGPRYIHDITDEGITRPRARHVLTPLHMPGWLANTLAPLGMAYYPFQAKNPLVPARALKNIPVFFIHGVEDPLLPFEATLEVYAAKPGEKRLWLIPDVGHAQEAVLAKDAEYAAQLGDFFQPVLTSPTQPGTRLPSLTCEIVSRNIERLVLRLKNNGPPGAVLTTVVGEQTADFKTIWVRDVADIFYPARPGQLHTNGLRLFEVEQNGDATSVRQTVRGHRYQTVFQPYIRGLSKLLHESRLQEIEAFLPTLPQEKPEAPFDFFLGVYCIQIMRRTRRKFPHIAKAAADAFTRYWSYGAKDGQDGLCSLWELAATMLDKPVNPPPTAQTSH